MTKHTTRITTSTRILISLLAGLGQFAAAEITTEPTLLEALKGGTSSGNVRFRLESGEQKPLESATAATARLRLGYVTDSWKNLKVGVEFEGSRAVEENDYNGAGVSGSTNKTVIADPPSTELNQAYLQYQLGSSSVTLGRQRLVVGNVRFVGDVGWRQNNQTIDGAVLKSACSDDLSVVYGYLTGVNRIFGSEATGAKAHFESDSHVAQLVYTGLPFELGVQAFLLDFDNANALSSDTIGAYVKGVAPVSDEVKLAYYLEVARQEAGDNNPADYEADYLHGTISTTIAGITLIGGYELLGSDDGTASFKTPLATLHKFNGWADKFLATPAGGLEDVYVGLSSKLPGGLIGKAFYHDFSADEGGGSYGDELDLLLVKPVKGVGTFIAKYANYSADGLGTDTERYSFEYNMDF